MAELGELWTAPSFPHKTYRGRPVLVTGRVAGISPSSLTLKTGTGSYTVLLSEARRLPDVPED